MPPLEKPCYAKPGEFRAYCQILKQTPSDLGLLALALGLSFPRAQQIKVLGLGCSLGVPSNTFQWREATLLTLPPTGDLHLVGAVK